MCVRVSIVSLALFLLFVAAWNAVGHAQPNPGLDDAPHTALRVRFDHLRVEHGLSQGSVGAILQDRKGFLWFGTDDGLNRFDGYQFLVFRAEAEGRSSLAGNVITALAEDAVGGMWIGTSGAGFQLFRPASREFVTPPQVSTDRRSLSTSVITALQVDRRRRVWIGTERDGLHVFDPASGVLQVVDLVGDGSRPVISSISSTRSGRIVVAAREAGLFVIDEDSLFPTQLAVPPDQTSIGNTRTTHGRMRDTDITQVLVEADRYIWITTSDGLLARHDVRTGRWKHIRLSVTGRTTYESAPLTMTLDKEGRLWIGTRAAGVILYDIRHSRQHSVMRNALDPESLPGNSIRCVYQDRSGNVWIGSNGNGLGLFSPVAKEFSLIAPGVYGIDRMPIHSFRAIWQGRDSVLWLGGYGGFCRIDRRMGAIQCESSRTQDAGSHRSATLAPASTVYSILPYPSATDDALLVGTEGSGLYRLDTRSMRFTRLWPLTGDSLERGALVIYELATSRDGSVWIGTQDGVYRWMPGKDKRPLRVAAEDIGMRQGAVFSIFEDRNGFLWIGTERGGLAYYDRLADQVTYFMHRREHEESIASNTVRCVYEDSEGRLWIGTSGGLDLMDVEKGRFRHTTTQHGLPNNVIYGILEDISGYLWLSTNQGIARYSHEDGVVATYDAHDGLQGNEFNTSAFFRSPSGELFFGGVGGVTHFYPERIVRNLVAPPVVISSVREGNRDLLPRGNGFGSDTVIVDHTSESIGVTFAALNYYRPEKNRYRYRIVGRDEEFIDLGTEHTLGFVGLGPGSYVIQIQGSNNDGVWNHEGVTLTLVVLPPFWGTWWFRLLVGLVVAVAVIVLVRWRLGRVRQQERLLAEEVAHRTSELQHANTKLLQEIEERKRAEAEAYRANATKGEFLAHISHEIRTPMNAILGFTELLQDHIHDEEQRSHLHSIAISGRTLLTLINDVLDLSKIEAGKLELSFQPASIRSIIQEIQQLFTYQVRQKNLDFVVAVAPAVPRIMYLDEIRIRQILLNLVGNAVKFTEKGSIRLDVNCAETDGERCTLHIRLADTGVGIAPSQQDRIFEPFRQGGRGRNTDYSGTGLGLAITQRLVHMMEGEITYATRLGAGTTFKVELPGVLVAEELAQQPHDHMPPATGPAIERQESAQDPVGMESAASSTPPGEAKRTAPSAMVLDALHAELLREDLPRWERLQRTYIMHEIELFASELRAKGERADFEPLRDWADRLLRDARNFDMDQLPRTLSEFPGILAVLHDQGNNPTSPSATTTHD